MNFTKMQGTGNDFIIFNCLKNKLNGNLPEIATTLCDRHFGIGADGIILVLPSEKEDLRMQIFNADGSEAEMCGNGTRCFAFYVFSNGIIKEKTMRIETLAGTIIPEIISSNEISATIKIDMGEPRFDPKDIPVKLDLLFPIKKAELTIVDKSYYFVPVGMGNPHAVIEVDDVDEYPVAEIGPMIENNSIFPNKTNVEFIQIISPTEIKMRVWERGSEETLACGTGACASLVAANLLEKANNKATVHLLGGDLEIEWKDQKNVFLTGAAEIVFEGRVEL